MHGKLVLSAALSLLTWWGLASPRQSALPYRPGVVVVVVDMVTWEDIERANVPNLHRLMDEGSVALFSVRSRPPETMDSAYLTLGAGSRAAAPAGSLAWTLGENEWEKASRCFPEDLRRAPRITGPGVTCLRASALQELNKRVPYPVQVGALGEELRKAGLTACVLGNADLDEGYEELRLHREAAAIAMDALGHVHLGKVDKALAATATGAYQDDGEALFRAFQDFAPRSDLLVIALGDTVRAAIASNSNPRAAREALQRADGLLGRLLGALDLRRTTVYLVSPQFLVSGRHPLAPFIAAGAGVPQGLATSSTTHQRGVVCNIDLAPSVLRDLGLRPPAHMLGSAIAFLPDSRPDRLAPLRSLNLAAWRAASPYAGVGFAILNILTAVPLLVKLLTGGRFSRRSRHLLRVMLMVLIFYQLFVLSLPAVIPPLAGPIWTTVLIVVASLVLAYRAGRSPLAWLMPLYLVTALATCADQYLGGRLALTSPFGSAIANAGRFYGMGNPMMSILVASTVLASGLWLEQAGSERACSRIGVALGFALVAFTIGLPWWGANVGGVLTAAATFTLAWLLYRGKPLQARHYALVALVAIAAVAICVQADILRPASEHTHLAKTVARVHSGGLEQVAQIVQKKAEAMYRMLTFTMWSVPFIIAFAIVTRALLRPAPPLSQALREHPQLSRGIRAVFFGAVVAALTNDSGIALAALMTSLALPALALPMLEQQAREPQQVASPG